MCVRLFFAFSPDNELLFRSRDGNVLRFNADTLEKHILVNSKMFVSSVRPCPVFDPVNNTPKRTGVQSGKQSLIMLSVPA